MKRLLPLLASLAFCAPAYADATHTEHMQIVDELTAAGVIVALNIEELCKDNWGGGSYLTHPVMPMTAVAICQDNGETAGDGKEVEWTANDYDTLRHEAHHALQDCLDGTLADRKLTPLFEGQKWKDFVQDSLTPSQIIKIITVYTENGADEDRITIELEAFATAATVSPTNIAESIKRVCGALSN